MQFVYTVSGSYAREIGKFEQAKIPSSRVISNNLFCNCIYNSENETHFQFICNIPGVVKTVRNTVGNS